VPHDDDDDPFEKTVSLSVGGGLYCFLPSFLPSDFLCGSFVVVVVVVVVVVAMPIVVVECFLL
jgi:hypothetical protein